jgi:class II flagellar assembly regulator FliX
MRIYGSNGAALASAPASARRAVAGGFTLDGQDPARQQGAASSLRAISSLDALLALQGIEDFKERRKRAVVKGRNALDALDALKIGLLDGSVDTGTLSRLKVAAEGLTEETGDASLNAVMHEIDLRVAVELAKAGAA